MPWKENTTMSQRQEFVQEALKESANIRALCREYGITPRTGYKWIKRYQEQGKLDYMIVAAVPGVAHAEAVRSLKKLCEKYGTPIRPGADAKSNGN